MIRRKYWLDLIGKAWAGRSVIWLSGVRRAGKTVLSRSLSRAEYFDCELLRVREMMKDPEEFLRRLRGKRVVFDEIHRLDNPSELLKIAADYFHDVKVFATGSSTLGASRKFRDVLIGRKATIWLTPMTMSDLKDFKSCDLARRLVHGGLPPFFLRHDIQEGSYQDWMDMYWAKDIEELFRLQRRSAFQRFTELLMKNSGGMFESAYYAKRCEVSRTTIMEYIAVLEDTHVAHVLRPFSSRRAVEIVAAPKVYVFDTGFICHSLGWDRITPENRGILWEHLVLNEIHAGLQTRKVNYWRDKHGNEVDFVLPRRGMPPLAIECKWSADRFDPRGMLAFLRAYPGAGLFLAASDLGRTEVRKYAGTAVTFTGINQLPALLREKGKGFF
jgi:hypothetical protein